MLQARARSRSLLRLLSSLPSTPSPKNEDFARRMNNRITNMKRSGDVTGVLNLFTQLPSLKFNEIHLANIFGTLAKTIQTPADSNRLQSGPKFSELLSTTTTHLVNTPTSDFFTTRQLSSITHSLGKLGIYDQSYFNGIESVRDMLSMNGNSQALANIAWGCARVQFRSEPLFASIATQSARVAQHGKPQELSNLLWAFAKLDIKSKVLFESVANQYHRVAKQGNVQDLSIIVWSFATSEVESDQLFKAVEGERGRIVDQGSVHCLSNICWAFAKNAHRSPSLFEAVARQAERMVARIIMVGWGCRWSG